MSEIRRLIAELCPDGVEYKTLGKISSIKTGEQLNKTKFNENGKYPVLNGGISASGFYNEYNTEGLTIAISQGGASAGYVNFMSEQFWAGAHCFVVKPSKYYADNKFLFYFLKHNQTNLQNTKRGAGIPGLSKENLEQLKIPVPPMEVQEEIVRILDKFTILEAELEAELEARRKQYEYYLDKLAGLETAYPKKALGDLCTEIYRGSGIKRDEVTERGIGYVRYGEIYTAYSVWFEKCTSHTNEKSIKNRKYFGPGDVLFAITGEKVEEIGKSTVYVGEEKCLAGGDTVVLKHQQNPKYMGYALSTSDAQRQKSDGKVKSKVVHSSVPALKKILIPVPPLQEQARIVAIIDRFHALVNDLSEGLPAEIAARRKQYEYYREMLLSFEEKAA